jgi:hypothetical protein
MYLVPIAWIYVVLMMSVAEATNSNGTVLGAIVTFVLYGMLPVALIFYFMGTPSRLRKARAREAAAQEAAVQNHAQGQTSTQTQTPSFAPNAGSHSATDPIAPVREEP